MSLLDRADCDRMKDGFCNASVRFWALNGHIEMSAIWSLLGAKRTSARRGSGARLDVPKTGATKFRKALEDHQTKNVALIRQVIDPLRTGLPLGSAILFRNILKLHNGFARVASHADGECPARGDRVA